MLIFGICKYKNVVLLNTEKYDSAVPIVIKPAKQEAAAPFIKVHGNILYDFSYRSYIDTPFAQSGLTQHLVQTSLNFLIKDKYPVRMILSNRSSNSPYFKNITDVNVQFNRYQLLDNIKENLKTKATDIVNKDALLKAEEHYKNKLEQVKELKTWLNNTARIQELIEEKENELNKRIALASKPSLADINARINAPGWPAYSPGA
ncbi:MAG: hypothetical protein IPJ81_08240 [Chitinophagaceae bacterium]|nr:hypothetical protein [Chitinophagaceae bacterium]